MSTKTKRILMSIFGVLICGISVGMFKHARLGVDPFQSLMSGLNIVLPISFGTLYLAANVVLLLFSLIFDRKKIGIATLINLTLLGYVAEFSQGICERIMPGLGRPGRVILLLVAVLIMCVASSLYFTADLGVSTYDAVSLVISQKNTRLPFRFWRIASDVICVVLGIVLSLIGGGTMADITANVGVGTIITAFFMGPLIQFFNENVAAPMLRESSESR